MQKILLIEDDLDVRENVGEILEVSGYDVVAAENGLIGVKKAKEFSPDLIICDVMMPEMDGFSVLYSLSKNPELASIPFIFLTAKGEKDDIRKGMRLGADDYLTKPFETSDLLQAIEIRLEKNKLLKENYSADASGLGDLAADAKVNGNWQEILDAEHALEFKKKDVVYRIGGNPLNVYYLISGTVKLSQLHKDGKELLEEIHTAGQFFGHNDVIAGNSYTHTATCLEDCEIVTIPKNQFDELLNTNNDFKFHLLKILSGEVKNKEEELIEVTYGTVRSRVAAGLKKLADHYGDQHVPLSREELAQFVGIATETLIRTLTEFKNEGLVTMDGKKLFLSSDKLDQFKF